MRTTTYPLNSDWIPLDSRGRLQWAVDIRWLRRQAIGRNTHLIRMLVTRPQAEFEEGLPFLVASMHCVHRYYTGATVGTYYAIAPCRSAYPLV